MRAVIQRVHSAEVVVDSETIAAMEAGLLVYLGVGVDDDERDCEYLAQKVRFIRVFPDADKPLNRDVIDAGGSVLVVSAFATQADARKGRRPALTAAAEPQSAQRLYELFCTQLQAEGVKVQTGRFRVHMDVKSVNDGPICILLDSKKLF